MVFPRRFSGQQSVDLRRPYSLSLQYVLINAINMEDEQSQEI